MSETGKMTQGAYLLIQGGYPLSGEVTVHGAKNAALPALVAACLSDEATVLHNVPVDLQDVRLLIELLRGMGASVRMLGPTTVECSGANWTDGIADGEFARKLRHSILLLGAAARWHTNIVVPLPGGCALGNRKHDLHTYALREMGFVVGETADGISLAPGSMSEDVDLHFHYPTFGGTLNTLFAAVGRPGKTIIRNAARNPEVLDVVRLMCAMGAAIRWADEHTLIVEGGRRLRGTEHRIIADRIVVATLIAAAAVTQGEIFIGEGSVEVLSSEVEVWRRAGLSINSVKRGIIARYARRLTAESITTRAYPGFHTDIQPLHAVMMSLASGTTYIKETILDGRFQYVPELRRMGAVMEVQDGGFLCVNGAPGQILKITGVESLSAASLIATDIRGGAAVLLGALAADGESTIGNIYQLERGYSDLAGMFQRLGARVSRVDVPPEQSATPAVAGLTRSEHF